MNNETRSYKYSCRTCQIRMRCINDKSFGPGLKISIARRFENRTDTFETWEMLQQDCLLMRYERQEAAQRTSTQTGLGRRLRGAQQDAERPPSVQREPSSHEPARRPISPTSREWPKSPPASPIARASVEPRSSVVPCGLTLAATQRIVRLPDNGEVILGRFEHGFSNPPDVDLTLADGEIPSVSRRHARITSVGGRHWIEDMGSSNGTYVNGRQVPLGDKQELAPRDRILLGRCRLVHDPLPAWISDADALVPHTSYLLVTHTGHRLDLPEKDELMIGRPDPSLNYVPDADLSVAGEIGRYVSRRHARLIVRGGWHYLEEMGSASGSRVNGQTLEVGGAPFRLQPGDQVWLGGCVVAYEWELH